MNNLRTLLLIPVFFFQISGILINSNRESLQLSENRKKMHTSPKIAESTNDLQILKKEEISCVNSPICRKETPLKFLVQPATILKEDLPVKVTRCENKRPPRRIPASIFIRFIGTGDAELF